MAKTFTDETGVVWLQWFPGTPWFVVGWRAPT